MKKWIAILIASVGLVAGMPSGLSAEDPAMANRNAIEDCLRKIALRAQVSYQTPISAGGTGGSFAIMTFSNLVSWPFTSYGSFYLSSPTATSVVFTGTGIETGWNGDNPVEVEVTVYSDSILVSYNN